MEFHIMPEYLTSRLLSPLKSSCEPVHHQATVIMPGNTNQHWQICPRPTNAAQHKACVMNTELPFPTWNAVTQGIPTPISCFGTCLVSRLSLLATGQATMVHGHKREVLWQKLSQHGAHRSYALSLQCIACPTTLQGSMPPAYPSRHCAV